MTSADLAPFAPAVGAALGSFAAHLAKRVPSAAQVRSIVLKELTTVMARLERIESWLKIPPYQPQPEPA